MGKNNFYQLENQFQQAGIATSEFQKVQQSSEKKFSFCYTENRCPLARMKNSLKNTFPLDGKTVFTVRNIWQMEKTVLYQPEKAVFTRSKDVFL